MPTPGGQTERTNSHDVVCGDIVEAGVCADVTEYNGVTALGADTLYGDDGNDTLDGGDETLLLLTQHTVDYANGGGTDTCKNADTTAACEL